MRVTMQCGRAGSARHDARAFDLTLADHIDPKGDRYWQVYGAPPGLPPEEAELAVYRERYGKALEAQNARHRARRHPERVRTMEQVYRARQTRPEEVILQIGAMQDGVDGLLLARCVGEWVSAFRQWCRDHGNPCRLLSIGVHLDESTPHAHIRRVWEYRDDDGHLRIGQERALERAGVPLPHPDKVPGRYNSRKMTVDMEMRRLWQDIVERHGIKVEREPRPSRRGHLTTRDYVAEQLSAERDGLRAEVDALRAEREALRGAIQREETLDERLAGVRARRRLEALEERYPGELRDMEDRLRKERREHCRPRDKKTRA